MGKYGHLMWMLFGTSLVPKHNQAQAQRTDFLDGMVTTGKDLVGQSVPLDTGTGSR